MSVTPGDITSSLVAMRATDFFKKAFAAQQSVTFGPTEALINANVSDDYTKSALHSLLNNLKGFTKCMSDSVYDPIAFGSTTIRPPDSDSNHYVGDLISTQTELDLARINTILGQRQEGSPVKDFLKEMDSRALKMVQWAVERGLFHSTFDYQPDVNGYNLRDHIEPCPAPLVFFGGNETSRTVPYTPVAPLSLPAELMDLAQNSSSLSPADFDDFYHLWVEPMLAYEVGRLIFWKGEMPDASQPLGSIKFARFLNLQMQDKGCSEWISNAIAGIFSDVFATMWCDNSAVGYAIRRATSKRNESYLAEDMRYQLSWFLRPYVSLKTLELMGGTDHSTLLSMWKTWEKDLYFANVRKYSEFNMGDANKDSICKLADTQILPKEVTVYSAGKSFNLGFNIALAEIEEATSEIYKLLNNLSGSALAPLSLPASILAPWLDGNIWSNSHHQALVPLNVGINYFIEVWFGALSIQTRDQILKAADNGIIPGYVYETYYHNQRIYWTTLLYSGGWMMESSGNTGGPH